MAILVSQLQGKSQAELIAMLVAQSQAAERKVTLKVSEKGAVSLYGLGRFPVTLYSGQWEKVIGLVQSGELAKFIEANKARLSVKP
jgi:hypothetical protein